MGLVSFEKGVLFSAGLSGSQTAKGTGSASVSGAMIKPSLESTPDGWPWFIFRCSNTSEKSLRAQTTTYNVCRRLQHLLIDTRHRDRWQKDEVLTARNLAIHIFIIVLMQSGHTAGVANPEVNRVGLLFKRDSCPSDVCFDIVVQC